MKKTKNFKFMPWIIASMCVIAVSVIMLAILLFNMRLYEYDVTECWAVFVIYMPLALLLFFAGVGILIKKAVYFWKVDYPLLKEDREDMRLESLGQPVPEREREEKPPFIISHSITKTVVFGLCALLGAYLIFWMIAAAPICYRRYVFSEPLNGRSYLEETDYYGSYYFYNNYFCKEYCIYSRWNLTKIKNHRIKLVSTEKGEDEKGQYKSYLFQEDLYNRLSLTQKENINFDLRVDYYEKDKSIKINLSIVITDAKTGEITSSIYVKDVYYTYVTVS